MDISRRRFVLGAAGAAVGLILPGYYRRALEFIDRTGRPLLELAERAVTELLAFQGSGRDLQYSLPIGDPSAGPPPMTLRNFCEALRLYAVKGFRNSRSPPTPETPSVSAHLP